MLFRSFINAFADELNVTTRSAKDNQFVLDLVDIWLEWTRTMAAKPRKCVSLAFRQFREHCVSQRGFKPYHKTLYSPYDSKLTITGKQFRSLFPYTREQKHDGPIISSFS